MLCPNGETNPGCKNEVMEKLPRDVIDHDEEGTPIYDELQSHQCMNCGEYDYSL